MSCKRQLLKLCNRPDRNRTTCFLKDEYRLDGFDLTAGPANRIQTTTKRGITCNGTHQSLRSMIMPR